MTKYFLLESSTNKMVFSERFFWIFLCFTLLIHNSVSILGYKYGSLSLDECRKSQYYNVICLYLFLLPFLELLSKSVDDYTEALFKCPPWLWRNVQRSVPNAPKRFKSFRYNKYRPKNKLHDFITSQR